MSDHKHEHPRAEPLACPTTQLESVNVFSGTATPSPNGTGPGVFNYRLTPPSPPGIFPQATPSQVYLVALDSYGVIYPISYSTTSASNSSVVLQLTISRPIPIPSFGPPLTVTIQLDYGDGYGEIEPSEPL